MIIEADPNVKEYYSKIEEISLHDRGIKIRGRVTQFSGLRVFKRKKTGSDYQVMNVTLTDEGGSIQVTFWGEQAITYSEQIEVGQIYSLENFSIKESNKYNTTQHRYQLNFNDKSVIKKLQDDQNLPQNDFNFKTIEEISGLEENQRIDIIAIVDRIMEPDEITLKNGEKRTKRTV